ncbi:MAG TPA: (2Fe-2S)-binding protein [Thermoanaerobaculia bacterium]|jgi:xanthine dehydrogenase YagT iron-sulfur-binding subunit|nr:(2Fe-2S)-binding protein [Thermoanaerobaculia bacterium]
MSSRRDDSDEDPRGSAPGGLSRRALLRGGAVAGLGAGLLSSLPALAAKSAKAPAEPAKTEAGVALLGPGPVAMKLQVNGKEHAVKLEPRVTLLDALRDHLDFTGAKKVCDRGTCGACTVILDGKTVYACSVLAIEAQGSDIQTVEGLGTVEKLHPLQAAFVENDAHQCGFCTPGFVMASKALLDANPAPTLPEIHHALSGNFCRCGTYAGIRGAVLGAAAAYTATAAEGDTSPEPSGNAGDDARPKKKKKKKRNDG